MGMRKAAEDDFHDGQCDQLILGVQKKKKERKKEQVSQFVFSVERTRETVMSFVLEITEFKVMWSDQQDM